MNQTLETDIKTVTALRFFIQYGPGERVYVQVVCDVCQKPIIAGSGTDIALRDITDIAQQHQHAHESTRQLIEDDQKRT